MIRALILCALLAVVGGAEELKVIGEVRISKPTEVHSITLERDKKCLPINDKNVPVGYCVITQSKGVLMWCPCPETVEQKVEKLEKRVAELERKKSTTLSSESQGKSNDESGDQ